MKYSVNIYPESKAANTKLFGFISYAGSQIRIQIARIDADSDKKWNRETSRCAPNSRHGLKKIHSSVVNSEIEKFINAVDSFFVIHATDTTPPPSEDLKRFVKSRMKGEEQKFDSHTIFDDYDVFMRTEAANMGWSLSTTKKHKTLKNDLQAISPRLKYTDITPSFYTKFVKYLTEKGNRTGTVKKKLANFEWFLNWVEENGRAPKRDKSMSSNIKLKTIKRPVIFLSWEELMKVYNLDLSKAPHLERARDVFCFQCFTGLRYSDVAKLKRIHIYNDAIHVLTEKTYDPLTIELNSYSKALLDKYKDYVPDPTTLHHIPREGVASFDYAMPVISGQKYNKYIKEFAEMAGIDTPILMPYFVGNTRHENTYPKYKLVASHAARRTFICTALALGINVTTVMKWSGHKSFEAMKPYIDVASEEKRNAMSLFDKKQTPQNSVSENEPSQSVEQGVLLTD